MAARGILSQQLLQTGRRALFSTKVTPKVQPKRSRFANAKFGKARSENVRWSQPSKPAVERPMTVVVPQSGLTAHELSSLTARPLNRIIGVAQELEPALAQAPETRLSAALVELVVDSLKVPFVVKQQAVSLERRVRNFNSDEVSSDSFAARVPVVTIMGHVDVGKTTLLDALRKSNVAENEKGGITQSIGAFGVSVPESASNHGPRSVTFIDTPGHEAFTSMRAHGAGATDIVVVVVAADDGVMPQTIEAIEHARSAGVPIVVAINKCDKEGANPDRVRFQLLDLAGVNTEQLGGDVQCVEISARTGLQLDSLLEAVLLQAEMLDLRSDPSSPAYGVCLESRCDRQIGNVASLVVKSGTLRVGDLIVHSSLSALSGDLYGRIRMMFDPNGHSVSEASAGTAVAVAGLKDGISPGAEFLSVVDERKAKALSHEMITLNSEAVSTLDIIADNERRAALKRVDSESEIAESGVPQGVSSAATGGRGLNDSRAGKDITTGKSEDSASSVPFINVIVKADVQGAADAVAQCVKRQATKECPIRVLQVGVGDVVENDILLASAMSGLKGNQDECYIVAFNVRVRAKTAGQARGKLRVLSHSLIYKVEEEIEGLVKMLTESRQRKERIIGAAGVVRVFDQGSVAGCLVQDGAVGIGAHCRVLRFPRGESTMTREVIHEAKIASLKQFAKDSRSVGKGAECGVALQDWSGFEPGDVLECIEIDEGSLKAGRRGRHQAQ